MLSVHRWGDDNEIILLPLIVIDYSGLQLCIQLTLAVLQQSGMSIYWGWIFIGDGDGAPIGGGQERQLFSRPLNPIFSSQSSLAVRFTTSVHFLEEQVRIGTVFLAKTDLNHVDTKRAKIYFLTISKYN